jgi:hypothetical protein
MMNGVVLTGSVQSAPFVNPQVLRGHQFDDRLVFDDLEIFLVLNDRLAVLPDHRRIVGILVQGRNELLALLVGPVLLGGDDALNLGHLVPTLEGQEPGDGLGQPVIDQRVGDFSAGLLDGVGIIDRRDVDHVQGGEERRSRRSLTPPYRRPGLGPEQAGAVLVLIAVVLRA